MYIAIRVQDKLSNTCNISDHVKKKKNGLEFKLCVNI